MTSLRGRLATQLIKAIGLKRRLRQLADVDDHPTDFSKRLARLRRTDRRRPPRAVHRRWDIDRIDESGFDLFVMTKKDSARSERVLLYLHGGGYLFGPFGTEWSAMRAIADGTAHDFAMLMYPRAPEHEAATTLQITRAAYARLEREYGVANIVVVGTSAGGGLAIALLAELRERGAGMPPCAVLLSPGVDMTLERDVAHLEESDVVLSVEHVRSAGSLYAGSLGADHPAVSPLFGDLAGLPTIHVFVGSRELLRPSIEAFADRAIRAGTDVRLIVGDDQQHTWPAAPTPEGRQARRQIVELIRFCS